MALSNRQKAAQGIALKKYMVTSAAGIHAVIAAPNPGSAVTLFEGAHGRDYPIRVWLPDVYDSSSGTWLLEVITPTYFRRPDGRQSSEGER